MLEIAIIADDMTGAADTGIRFLSSLSPVYLTSHNCLKSLTFKELPRALAVYTDTRSLPAVQAKMIVREVAEALRKRGPGRIYKKIDSTLRGNIVGESEVMLEVLCLESSFIAPAFPEQGRTTLAGTHLVHGRPVSETESARDPLTPVTSSCLPDWIRRQTRLQVGHIGLDLLEGENENIVKVIDRLQGLGVSHYTFDVSSQVHLDRIASLAIQHYPRTLLCGSAGLAQSLASSFTSDKEGTSHFEDIPLRKENFLLVCGSASETMQRQVSKLVKAFQCAREILDPRFLADPDGRGAWEDLLRRTASTLSQQDLLLQIGPLVNGVLSRDPESLIRGLSHFVGLLVKRIKPGGLFISGGDTASAVLDVIEGNPVRLLGQISGGLVHGTIMGGSLAGLPLVTKAGAFGNQDTLIDFYNLLSRRKFKTNGNNE